MFSSLSPSDDDDDDDPFKEMSFSSSERSAVDAVATEFCSQNRGHVLLLFLETSGNKFRCLESTILRALTKDVCTEDVFFLIFFLAVFRVVGLVADAPAVKDDEYVL